MISLHLIRQGEFALANKFMEEARLEVPIDLLSEFTTMFDILVAFKQFNLIPAIQWTKQKKLDLDQRSSNLPFQLHRLRFIQIFLSSGIEESLHYARSNFADFQARHLSEIQSLMCAFLFASNLSSSPYAPLFSDMTVAFSDVTHAFTQEFCSLLGFSSESPLHIATTAGSLALPALLKLSTVMKKSRTEWTTEGELPVEIQLPDNYKFHSIFRCPVSKEQSTEENPPLLLPCGHCFNKDSLGKLSKGGQGRFKCPYCPSEATYSQAMRIWF